MTLQLIKRCSAALAIAALAACSGSGGAATAIPQAAGPATVSHDAPPRGVSHQDWILSRIVGVGDSLTAGYQSAGFLGDPRVKNPYYPGTNVPPGQENGFWADVVEQASGLPLEQAVGEMYNPAISPLPLIAGPGLNNQLVPSLTTGIAQLKTGDTCSDNNGFNAAGYVLNGAPRVRLDWLDTNVRDVAVPGITLHEAITLGHPQSSTCVPLPGVPGLLQQVVDGESSTFWPVLANFSKLPNLTEVNAARSLRPTLATVWLGANDVLKFMGSGGRFTGGDQTAAQARQDLSTAITTLQYSGAKVVVANLPDIVLIPYLMNANVPKSNDVCAYQTYAYCVFLNFGIPAPPLPGNAAQLVNQLAKTYHLSAPGCVPASTTAPCGYLTLQGTLATLTYYLQHHTVPNLDPAGPGSGLGLYYITPALAGRIQSLNDQINMGIDEAAQQTQSPLVDVKSIFEGIAGGKQSNPYYFQATHINAPLCCTLSYQRGLVSFDGAHPSNTGYALIAYYFIKAINQRYNLHIRQIDIRAAYDGKRCKVYCFPDPYAPH